MIIVIEAYDWNYITQEGNWGGPSGIVANVQRGKRVRAPVALLWSLSDKRQEPTFPFSNGFDNTFTILIPGWI